MKKFRPFISICFTVLLVTLASPALSHAALGDGQESIDVKDRGPNNKTYPIHNTLKRRSSHYTVHQLDSASNSVREYVSSSNVIFAVCWNGLTHANLSNGLLGSYQNEFEQKLNQTLRVAGKRNRIVKTDHLNVVKNGHMGNLKGCAVIPSLVPSGVGANELK